MYDNKPWDSCSVRSCCNFGEFHHKGRRYCIHHYVRIIDAEYEEARKEARKKAGL